MILPLPAAIKAASAALRKDGFVFLPRLVPAPLIAQIREVCDHHAATVMAHLGEDGQKEMGVGSAAGFDEVCQRSPGRFDVPIAPGAFDFGGGESGLAERGGPWWPYVAELLGSDAEHSFAGVVFSQPGSPSQEWHTDSPHLSATHLEPHAVNCLLALEDIPLEMGPTEMARGSHRSWTNHLQRPSLVLDELLYQHETTNIETLTAAPVVAAAAEAGAEGGVDVGPPTSDEEALPEPWTAAMPAGSCLIFDDRILHRGLGNSSTSRTRPVAYFSYKVAGYEENTHFEASRSLFEQAS